MRKRKNEKREIEHLMSHKHEKALIRFSIVLFWSLFWLFNFIDKVIPGAEGFWVGKDRFVQFTGYFASIGVENPTLVGWVLGVVSVLELLAFVFMTFALVAVITKKKKWAHSFTFWGVIISLAIFTFFGIGDQIFGDRTELLEHSIYWMALIISWFMYTKTEEI